MLASDALRDQVEDFKEAWTRRLAILGVTAHVTYDDNRAVFDLTGDFDVDEVAHALADATPATLDGQEILDGYALTWLPATAACACSSRVRVVLPRFGMCNLDGHHELVRDGLRVPMLGRVRWMMKLAENKVVEIDPPTHCSETVYAESVMFALPPDLSQADQTRVVLALGGGRLPAWPRVVR